MIINTNNKFLNYFCTRSREIENLCKSSNILTFFFLGMLFVLTASVSSSAAVFTVTKTADTNDGTCDTDCSLREAIFQANNSSADDVITFNGSVFNVPSTITLSGTELVIQNSGTLRIEGLPGSQITISGNNASRIFNVKQSAKLNINYLTITNGNGVGADSTSEGGGMFVYQDAIINIKNSTIRNNSATSTGGGIFSIGQVTIESSLIFDNAAPNGGGGVSCAIGALNIDKSEIYNNVVSNNAGGGISLQFGCDTVISNTTINNNSTAGKGGGVFNNSSEAVFRNSTIHNNSAGNGGGGISTFGTNSTNEFINSTISGNRTTAGGGGGVLNTPDGITKARNSIFADNIDTNNTSPDFGGVLVSGGYNLIENTSNTIINGTTTGNITGQDPSLGVLQQNGGITRTQRLLPGSVAIDAADPNPNAILETDQRGAPRPLDGDNNGSRLPDMGAFEAGALVVTKAADTDDGVCDQTDCSLREAIAAANNSAADDAIIFSNLFRSLQTITLNGNQLTVQNNGRLVINGTGKDLLMISGNNLSRVFFISPGATAEISRLTVKEGNQPASNGGGIYNAGVYLKLFDVIIRNNTSSNGGGIKNEAGTLEAVDSLITDNTATTNGGGINNTGVSQTLGIIILTNTIVSSNTSQSGGGGIYNAFGNITVENSEISNNTILGSSNSGGGINTLSGILTINNSRLKNNTATDSGGAIRVNSSDSQVNINASTISGNSAVNGGGLRADAGTTTINASTISGNRASFRGGGLLTNGGTINLKNSTVSGNSSSDDGGGIVNFGTINVESTTVSKNSAADVGGGFFNGNGPVTVKNSIIADNTSRSAPDFSGTLDSQGFNLIENISGTSIQGDTTGNITGVDPQLLPLGNYGGLTLTHALNPHSPAIDAGKSFGLTTDQRGLQRPVDNITPNAPGSDGSDIGAFEVQASKFFSTAPFDFDGDGKSDISVFRPTDSIWYLLRSQSGFGAVSFGISSDKIVPADYDGDGKTDIAVYRNGTWYILNSFDQSVTVLQFGTSEDLPRPADYDGDGKADIAVFRPSNGNWYYLRSSNNNVAIIHFGQSGDAPVIGDYDGDGKADLTVWRPSTGVWYSLPSSGSPTIIFQYGLTGDIPVSGDFDRDGKTDFAVFRSSTGIWYINNSATNNTSFIQFGSNGDIPAIADYDGDGSSDIAAFRPSNGVWYIRQSQGGIRYTSFGAGGDRPVPAAFVP